MKAKLEFEYDHSNSFARLEIERMQQADDAWSCLYKIKDIILNAKNTEEYSKHDMERLLDTIIDEIKETRLESLWQ